MNSKMLYSGMIWLSALAAIFMILYPPDTLTGMNEGIHTEYLFLFGGYLLDIQWGRLILELSIPAIVITVTLLMMKVTGKQQD